MDAARILAANLGRRSTARIVATAVIAYAAGLALGFGGVVHLATAAGALLAIAGVVRRDARLLALPRPGARIEASHAAMVRALNRIGYTGPLTIEREIPQEPERQKAEIGRAIVNFDGPIVFCVISRYHGGAFVVFSKRLNPLMEIAALEGSYASVIGGAPAAATVFTREVRARTDTDPRVVELREAIASTDGPDAGALRAQLARLTDEVRSEKLGQVADEFDAIHTIQRAREVGSVDRIISARDLRSYVVDAVERGMARGMAQGG